MIFQEKATWHNNNRPLVTWETLFCHSPEQCAEKSVLLIWNYCSFTMNDCVRVFNFQKQHLCDGSFMKLGLCGQRVHVKYQIRHEFTDSKDVYWTCRLFSEYALLVQRHRFPSVQNPAVQCKPREISGHCAMLKGTLATSDFTNPLQTTDILIWDSHGRGCGGIVVTAQCSLVKNSDPPSATYNIKIPSQEPYNRQPNTLTLN